MKNELIKILKRILWLICFLILCLIAVLLMISVLTPMPIIYWILTGRNYVNDIFKRAHYTDDTEGLIHKTLNEIDELIE